MKSVRELKGDLYNPFDKKNEETYDVMYTVFGKHDCLVDKYPVIDTNDKSNINIYAYKVVKKRSVLYYVKSGKNGFLFNPIGDSQGNERKAEWDFKKTTKERFLFYIDFLRTKNLKYLHQAERMR